MLPKMPETVQPISLGLPADVRSAVCLVTGSWQDFNCHDASHDPSPIAELLVETVWKTRLLVK